MLVDGTRLIVGLLGRGAFGPPPTPGGRAGAPQLTAEVPTAPEARAMVAALPLPGGAAADLREVVGDYSRSI